MRVTSMDDLSDRQLELINHLPASGPQLADELNITTSTVHDHVSEIRSSGYEIPYDQAVNLYTPPGGLVSAADSSKTDTQITREANEFLTSAEAAISHRLENSAELITSQQPEQGNEDMLLHVTDLHIGDLVTDDSGDVIYDPDVAVDVMKHITAKVLSLTKLMSNVATFDTIHVLYGGDQITNENLYSGQSHDIVDKLADQMSGAVEVMTQQLKSFAEEFDTVNVVCQPGNHGQIPTRGASKQANMDLVCYRWVNDRLRESEYTNINFQETKPTWYQTFELRGGEWTGFLIHGKDSLEHIGTDSGRNIWRGWLNEHEFDVGYRGHFHESKREPVQNGPMIYESPSPKPATAWASRIGKGSANPPHKRLATVHGVSDTRPVTWEFIIDDSGME